MKHLTPASYEPTPASALRVGNLFTTDRNTLSPIYVVHAAEPTADTSDPTIVVTSTIIDDYASDPDSYDRTFASGEIVYRVTL